MTKLAATLYADRGLSRLDGRRMLEPGVFCPVPASRPGDVAQLVEHLLCKPLSLNAVLTSEKTGEMGARPAKLRAVFPLPGTPGPDRPLAYRNVKEPP